MKDSSMPAATAGAPEREVGGKFPPREARWFPYSWSRDAAAVRQAPGETGQVDLNSKHDFRKTNTPKGETGHLPDFLSQLILGRFCREKKKDWNMEVRYSNTSAFGTF